MLDIIKDVCYCPYLDLCYLRLKTEFFKIFHADSESKQADTFAKI